MFFLSTAISALSVIRALPVITFSSLIARLFALSTSSMSSTVLPSKMSLNDPTISAILHTATEP